LVPKLKKSLENIR